MAEEKLTVSEGDVVPAAKEKKAKVQDKKPGFFARLGRGIKKLCTDTFHEMKKVVWTPKDELRKSTLLVIVITVAFAAVIALIDTGFSALINWIAGLIG